MDYKVIDVRRSFFILVKVSLEVLQNHSRIQINGRFNALGDVVGHPELVDLQKNDLVTFIKIGFASPAIGLMLDRNDFRVSEYRFRKEVDRKDYQCLTRN